MFKSWNCSMTRLKEPEPRHQKGSLSLSPLSLDEVNERSWSILPKHTPGIRGNV